jgi:thioredoxin-like negative regulator of GroEL
VTFQHRARPLLPWATFALLVLAACGRASAVRLPPPLEASTPIHFIEDDYARALSEARARGVPVFIDAWASWCHTCLSMRAFVFGDASLAALADRYVWLALDTERDDNAAIVTKLGVKVLPTLYVVDAADERVMLAWPGSLTARELVGLLDDTRSGGGPRGPLAVDAAVTKANHEGRLTDCVGTATKSAPQMPPGTALADVLRTGMECAEGLPKDAPERGQLADLAALGERVASDPSQPILADDRSDLYDWTFDAYRDVGRREDGSRVARAWATFLDAEAGRASTPAARAVFDAHRLLAYEALDEVERAVPMLQQSERDAPGDYNAPARLASAYLAMKRYDDALAAVNRALDRAYGPRKLRLWSLKADVLVARGDATGARATLTEALAFARTVPLPESYPKQVDAMTKRLAGLEMPDAGAGHPPPAPRKGPGAPCSGRTGECASGLACCQSGFHGHCGGVAPSAGEASEPCIVTSTCVAAPCAPLSFPP